MFGTLPSGEILFASLPKTITGPGGDNEITILSPGRSNPGDGPTLLNEIAGDTFGGEAYGGDTNGGDASYGETNG